MAPVSSTQTAPTDSTSALPSTLGASRVHGWVSTCPVAPTPARADLAQARAKNCEVRDWSHHPALSTSPDDAQQVPPYLIAPTPPDTALPPVPAPPRHRRVESLPAFALENIRRAAELAARLGSSAARHVLPGIDPQIFTSETALIRQEAESYLLDALARYDDLGGELRAETAGRAFFAEDPLRFDNLRESHTVLVNTLGFEGAVDHLAGRCEFGLTAQRCMQLFQQDPDFVRLWELASTGAGKQLPDTFVNQPAPLPPRRFQRLCGSAIKAHATKMAEDSFALILDNERIPPGLRTRLHHNNISWACHPDKDLGRFCNDDTYHQSGHALNSDWAKEAADTHWGRAHCPSIVEVVRSFLQFAADSGVPLSDMAIIKDDISKAFTQIKYSYEAAVRHATTPIRGSTMIQLRAVFGGDDSAQIWDCVARAIMRTIKARIACLATGPIACLHKYVDDFFGLVIVRYQLPVKDIIHTTVRQALGVSALNEGKSVPPVDNLSHPVRQKDIIGFDFDLVQSSLRPNEKGLHKLFIAFFYIDIGSTVPLKARQRCASLVQRFAPVMRGMLPFVQPLHDWCSPSKSSSSSANRFLLSHTTTSTRFCIEIWRVVIMAAFRNPAVLDVPLSFVAGLSRSVSLPPDYVAQTDASEMGACVSIWDPSHTRVLTWIQVLFPWGKDLETGGSNQLVRSAQNMREFTAYCFVLILLHLHPTLRSANTTVAWVGDNSAALSWLRGV